MTAATADKERWAARTATEIFLRGRDEIATYFGDFSLVEPGLVQLPLIGRVAAALARQYGR